MTTDQYYETIGGELKPVEKGIMENPMIKAYGQYRIRDLKCKTCKFFIRKSSHGGKFFKCEFRGNTNGPGTDHRANWPACGRYERK